MALSEVKVLVSVEVNVESHSVNIAWANRILRDGEVIQSVPHRGSWPLDDNGEPIGVDTTEIGAKISDILTYEGALAAQQLASERLVNADLTGRLDTLSSENAQLKSRNQELVDEITRLRGLSNAESN